jgi:uncharacterized membrane protein YfcA
MEIALPTLIALAALGAAAGWLGALVGIGGGVILVPALVLVLGVQTQVAVATSLVGVVATSTAAGSAYVGSGLTNMRLGMSLEVATTIGGITGGLVALYVSPSALAAIFGVVMAITSALVFFDRGSRSKDKPPTASSTPAATVVRPEVLGWESRAELGGAYWDEHAQAMVHYRAHGLPIGAGVSLVAGALSGMLGVGGGFLKVPAMSLGMKVPLRVAAATSNFMIGVTAIASLFVYFARGYVHPYLAAPVALGVIAGSLVGTKHSGRVPVKVLRWILSVVLIGVAIQMILRSLGVHLGR